MSEGWVKVADASEVPEGGTLQVAFGVESLCLFSVNGAIYATHDVCTHGQASLAEGFIVDDYLIECPLHQGTFDIRTGRAVGVPCTEDIRTYSVKVEDGAVFVKELRD